MESRAEPASLESHADASLVARSREGDAVAFEAIMRRYNRRLYRLARSLLRDESEAEDVVQETFVIAYTKLDTFRGPEGFGAWLSRIAANEALGRLRQRARTRSLDGPVGSEPIDLDALLARRSSEQRDPEAIAATGELRRLIEQAIDALPEHFRAVFVLRAVEGMGVAETAIALGLKPETVKTRFHRARGLLRRWLSRRVQISLSGVFPFAGARCDRIVAAVRARLGLG